MQDKSRRRIKVFVIKDRILSKLQCKMALSNNQEIQVYECLVKKSIDNDYSLIAPDIVITSHEVLDKYYNEEAFCDAKLIVVFDYDDFIVNSNLILTRALSHNSLKACAYITTNIESEALKLTVKSLFCGMCIVQKSIMDSLFHKQTVIEDTLAVPGKSNKLRLTEQERNVIHYIAKGKCNREIAQNLYLSEGRVKNIVSGVLKKLELNDRTQLAIYALKNNIY